jgi:uncharacterized membrane protein YkvA (DUF1232 family)
MVRNGGALKVRVADHRPMDIGWLPGVVIALVAVWAGLLLLFWLFRPKDVPIREVLRVIPDVVRLLRALIRDPAVPLDVRLVLVGLIVWIVSPIDLIPEFIPGIGPLDDVIVAVVAMRYVRRRIGIAGISTRWAGSDDGLRLLVRVIGT